MRKIYSESWGKYKSGENNSIVLIDPKNELIVMGFSGRSKKSKFYLIFGTLERRNEYIEVFFENQKKNIIKKKKLQEERSKLNHDNIELGTIYYTSWGYEQTNGEFYQLIEKKGKKTLILKEIGGKQVSSGMDCGYFEPIKDEFISKDLLETRVGSMYLGKSYHRHLSKYSGTAVYRSWYY